MSKLVDLEAIRKEVDSIKSIHIAECRPGDIDTFAKGICSGMIAIEQFLDTLPEEKIVNYLNVNLGSPDYARGFENGFEEARKRQLEETEEDKVIQYLVHKKHYPVTTSGYIPSYEELFETIKDGIEYQKSVEEKPLPGITKQGVPGKDYIPVEWVDACEAGGKWKIVPTEEKPVKLDEDVELGLDRALQIVSSTIGNLAGWLSDNGIYECDHAIRVLRRILGDSENQKPIDLEKEIDAAWTPRFNLGWDENSLLSINHAGFAAIAEHFFNLGRMAKKD